MFHYLYSNDMRITSLESSAKFFSQMFLSDTFPTAEENKSVNNSGLTIGYYLNLKNKGAMAKLAAKGDFNLLILNFIKTFQFPNPRTKDNCLENIQNGIQIAPLREILKVLFCALLANERSVYLTKDEILQFIFFNEKLAKNQSYNRYQLYVDITVYRANKTLPNYAKSYEEDNWKHYERQIKELLSILNYSGIAKFENDVVTLLSLEKASKAIKDFLVDLLNYHEFWDYQSVQTQDIKTLQQSYMNYVDHEAEKLLVYSVKSTSSFVSNIKYNLPKPFLILAGISGTGKTRFVREQAKASNNGKLNNYCLVPVRPDWHEPSDLLGYISRLSDKPKYIVTPLLKFMVEAWQEIAKSAVEISGNFISGNESHLAEIRPFWLCLDEMNLAPVEQYFADYLSIIETREWQWNGEEFTYQCDAILSKNIIDEFADSEDFWQSLGLDKESKLAHYFRENGIPLPFNLIVVGTVNMDETTHGFSRKVLDRALSFDFSEFYPNDFDEFFDPQTHNKVLSYPIYSSAIALDQEDKNIQESINFLKALNAILTPTPFKLGYRALNELLLTVESFKPKTPEELQALWDDFLMYKILPRIEGDSDKLATNKGKSNLLKDIEDYLKKSLYLIWDKPRHDFLRVDNNDQSIQVEQCRSRVKLAFMIDKLEFGFTAFWQ